MSEASSGRKPSAETKSKMSKAHKGKRNGMYGKTHTQEARKKISDKYREWFKTHGSKKVMQLDIDDDSNIIATWGSTMEIERQLDIDHRYISQCCLGKKENVGRFKWKYASDVQC